MSREQFDRELHRAVDGDPNAHPMVKRWWEEVSAEAGIVVALPHRDGVEIARRLVPGDSREKS